MAKTAFPREKQLFPSTFNQDSHASDQVIREDPRGEEGRKEFWTRTHGTRRRQNWLTTNST